jgi:ABC-type antimicrobial peptide transport system permease subunit
MPKEIFFTAPCSPKLLFARRSGGAERDDTRRVSKLVDRLVSKKPVTRRERSDDRRFQSPDAATLVVKSRHSADLLPNMIRDEIDKMNGQVIVTDVRTMDSVLSESITPLRFNVELFSLFGGFALVLAWIGIYGVMTYATVMRIREIAIRMALGASPHSILRLLMGRATRLAAAGILLGVSVSWFSTRLLRSVLYGISPHSTAVLVAVSLVVCSAAVLASYLQARRAMAVDPNVILRSE